MVIAAIVQLPKQCSYCPFDRQQRCDIGGSPAFGADATALCTCRRLTLSERTRFAEDCRLSLEILTPAEMAEAVAGGHHYRILFLLGALLFAVTFVTNLIGDFVMHHYKAKLEGKK